MGPINGADTGRCVADDISASNPGAEMWASSTDGLISATTNANLGTQAVVAELPDLVGRRRDARARGRHLDQQVRRQLDPERERLRVEQRHQVDADADRRSAGRLARGDHLAREQQLGAAPVHDDQRDDAADLHADARRAVPDAGVGGADRLQPAAQSQLPHRQRHGRPPRAEHPDSVDRPVDCDHSHRLSAVSLPSSSRSCSRARRRSRTIRSR